MHDGLIWNKSCPYLFRWREIFFDRSFIGKKKIELINCLNELRKMFGFVECYNRILDNRGKESALAN